MQYQRDKYRFLSASVPLLAVMLWAASAPLEASILLPHDVAIGADTLRDDAVSSSCASDSSLVISCETELPFDGEGHDSEPQGEVVHVPITTFPGGPTSGTSTSTSGASGASASPLDTTVVSTISDTELVSWVLGERRFSLPMPPGNDLLRPPQHR